VEGRATTIYLAKKCLTKTKNNTKGIPFAATDQRVIVPPSRFLLVGEKKKRSKEKLDREEK